MGNIFSGLEKFGLGNLKNVEVFEEKKKSLITEKKDAAAEKVVEADFLFDKTFVCPVCDTEFHSKMVRTGKVKPLAADTDLRPRYKDVDCIKYDALVCPKCGYAALNRFFKFLMPYQAKQIRETISKGYQGKASVGDSYSYDEAISRYQLALLNAVIKKTKMSEKAYICLKLAWLYRGKAESLPEKEENREKKLEELKNEEMELLDKAYIGFEQSFSKEEFPMCGMDEITVVYLVAELARRTGRYDASKRWISRVLTSRAANERIKNKAREIKALLEEDIKKEQTK